MHAEPNFLARLFYLFQLRVALIVMAKSIAFLSPKDAHTHRLAAGARISQLIGRERDRVHV